MPTNHETHETTKEKTLFFFVYFVGLILSSLS